jgi:hypothetical protein
MTRAVHTRRRFISRLIGLGALGLNPSIACSKIAERTKHDPLTSSLEQLLRHRESAVVIGWEYLRIAPAERDPRSLADLLSSACGKRVFDSDTETLRRCVSRQTRRDFVEGRIVKIHGWMLSLTEARLCGLATLVLAFEGRFECHLPSRGCACRQE